MCSVASVCVSVVLLIRAETFESLDLETSFLVLGYIFIVFVRFVYQGHQVNVKVMGAKQDIRT